MGYNIHFPTPLDEIDPHNDNLDICVTLDDGQEFTFVVATPDNLKTMIRNGGVPYLKPGLPFLIAEELTEDVITRLIEEIMEDDALLRIYGGDI